MNKRYDVIGTGISAVDDLLYVSNYPPVNCKIPVSKSARRGGGPACTAIAAVGALEGCAAYVARLGSSELSKYIQWALDRRGVDISHVMFDATSGPYHSVILVDSAGHRNVFYDPSLYRTVGPEDLPDSLIQSATVFLLDHLTEPSLTNVARKVRGLGVPILGDLEGCTESAKELATLIDYLVVSREFAAWASGKSDAQDACAELARNKRLATVVTCGSEGGYFKASGDEPVRSFPAFKVQAFNTNGCGDTFHGAFALAVSRNLGIQEAITFSSAAAALKATESEDQRGGWDTQPTLANVLEFLRARLNEPERSSLLGKLEVLGPQTRCFDALSSNNLGLGK